MGKIQNIWDKYFAFDKPLSRREFWKGIFWYVVFAIPLLFVSGLSAAGGVLAIFVIVPVLIFLEWMFAGLVVGRLRDLNVNPRWAIPIILVDLIPLVRLGYLVIFGIVEFGHRRSPWEIHSGMSP